jgi:hypothetical protein
MKSARPVAGTETTAVPQLETNRELVAEKTTKKWCQRARGTDAVPRENAYRSERRRLRLD